eukprot:2481549-Pleurochrysis_carterae.AAC.1
MPRKLGAQKTPCHKSRLISSVYPPLAPEPRRQVTSAAVCDAATVSASNDDSEIQCNSMLALRAVRDRSASKGYAEASRRVRSCPGAVGVAY